MTAHISCRNLIQIRLQIAKWRTKWRPCKALAVSQSVIFNFKCYSTLHFAVCQLLRWPFLFNNKSNGSEGINVTCLISIRSNSKLQINFYNFMDNFDKIQCIMYNLIRNVYYLDLELQEGTRSNLNKAIEIPCLASYLMSSEMLTTCFPKHSLSKLCTMMTLISENGLGQMQIYQ